MKWCPTKFPQVLTEKCLGQGPVLRWDKRYGPCDPGAVTVRGLRHQMQRFPTTGRDGKRHRPRIDRGGRFGEALEAPGQRWVKAAPHQIADPKARKIHCTTSK